MNNKKIYHFQAAQHDHHYLKLPFAEHWVDEAVKVIKLSNKFKHSSRSLFKYSNIILALKVY